MLPKRWLPLPTSREILRRSVATLTLAAYVLPVAGISVARAEENPLGPPRNVTSTRIPTRGEAGSTTFTPPPGTAPTGARPADGSLCSELDYVGGGSDYKAENSGKFTRLKNTLVGLTPEHRQPSPNAVKDAMLTEIHKTIQTGADPKDAVEAHELYLKYMANAADNICRDIQNFDNELVRVRQRVEAAKASQTNETCAFSDLQQITQGSSGVVTSISEKIERMASRMRTLYGEGSKVNKRVIEAHKTAALATSADVKHQAIDRARDLSEELKRIWGTDDEMKRAEEGKVLQPMPSSYMGRVLGMLEFQTEKVKQTKAGLDAQNSEMARLTQDECRSQISTQPGAGRTGAAPPPAAAAGAVGAGGARICAPGQVANFSNAGAAMDPSICTTPAPGISGPATPGTAGPGTATPGANNGNADDLRVDDPSKTGGPKNPSVPTPTPVEEESFLSKYKTPLIIGGVGVAAVAGALIYKKTEDDKAKKNARYMEMEAAMAVQSQQQNSSSSSSDSSGSSSSGSSESPINTDSTLGSSIAPNQTPMGSTLLVVNSPSGNYSTNSALPDITVKVLNPNGIATDDSTTDITVSCATATPFPCTLTGTLTVNTNLGKAVFSGLKFTGAHQNVTLQFSAGGFKSVQSGNFNVSARQ